MQQIQYRFFKYLITSLNRAVDWLETNVPTHTSMLWLSGIMQDVQDLCPDDLTAAPINLTADADLLGAFTTLREELITRTAPIIHAAFLFARTVSAAHMLPIHKEFSSDPNFAVVSVARQLSSSGKSMLSGSEWHDLLEVISDIDYVPYEDYKVERHLPDLVLETDVSDTASILSTLAVSQFKAYSTRIVNIPYSFFCTDEINWGSSFQPFSSAWLDCCNSQYIYDVRAVLSPLNIQNSMITGHPFFDISYAIRHGISGKELPDMLSKNNKYRLSILWNCEVIDQNFLDLIVPILQKYPDVLMISRPKPDTTPTRRKFDVEQDSLAQKYDNFVIDRSIDYTFALSAADALISELSSLYPQFIATGKPAAIYHFSTLMESSLPYWLQSKYLKTLTDISNFIDSLLSFDKLPESEITEFDRYYIGHTDGKNSKRIKNAALLKFYNEEKDFIDKYCPNLKQEELSI